MKKRLTVILAWIKKVLTFLKVTVPWMLLLICLSFTIIGSVASAYGWSKEWWLTINTAMCALISFILLTEVKYNREREDLREVESKVMIHLQLGETVKAKTYELLSRDGITVAIKCLKCGMTSYNRGDIENEYCGNCKRFHEFISIPEKPVNPGRKFFTWTTAIVFIASMVILRTAYLFWIPGYDMVIGIYFLCLVTLFCCLYLEKRIKRQKDLQQKIEQVKRFADLKAQSANEEINFYRRFLQQKDDPGLLAAQRVFRAYTSIVEILEGQQPSDPITREQPPGSPRS